MDFDKKDMPQSMEALVRVDKAKILGEARKLSQDTSITAPACREIIGQVARLLLSGEQLTEAEVEDLVTGTMFTFRFQPVGLRQMLHWLVKALASVPHLETDDYRTLFPNSVSGDAERKRNLNKGEGNENILRPNAIRALCRLYDASGAQTVAKALAPAVVDSDSSVQSAALVSLYHMLAFGNQHLRIVQSQIQAAFTQPRSSGSWAWPEYHALGLDYHSRLASEMLAKDIIKSGDGGFKNKRKLQGPAAKIFFCRFASELAEKGNYRSGAIEFLKEMLDSFESIEYDPTVTGDKESFVLKRSMVALEAAKTICNMENADPSTLDLAVQKLVDMANNSHQVVKFASMRALCTVASSYPNVVRKYNDTIRKQMKNSNKDIGSFATTTLLKTADEADVDSLMKEVGSLMTSASNDFKVVIVEAVTALCLKFSNKKAALAKFLGDYLKDEGSYEFKRAMVEGMFDLVKSIPETKEDVLLQLCEFIEDCEYPGLTIRVLHVVGTEGPSVKRPTMYIRYIYNRLVLENSLVRAAAVTALSKFGVGQKDPELKRSVHVLLSRSLDDEDDEVRDRAALSLRLMDGEDLSAPELIRNDSMFSLAEFEDRLAMYVTAEDRETFKEPFDLSTVPIVSREKARSEIRTKKLMGTTSAAKTPTADSKTAGRSGADTLASSVAASHKQYVKEMQAIPELAAHGTLLKSSSAIELTNQGTEYVVSVVKHIFSEHIVFQYNIENTMDNFVFTDVSVTLETEDEQIDLEEEFTIPVPELETGQTGIVYVSFKKVDPAQKYLSDAIVFVSTLDFVLNEVAEDSRQPVEHCEYLLDDSVVLAGGDFVMPAYATSFDQVWKQSYEEESPKANCSLSVASMQDAVDLVLTRLPLQPLDGTENAHGKWHGLKLYGKTLSGGKVAADVSIFRMGSGAIGMSITAKSEEKGVAEIVAKTFQGSK